MKKIVRDFIEQEAQSGRDPIYVMASMLGRQIIVQGLAEWKDEQLHVMVEVNPKLPLQRVPGSAVGLFLQKAEGRPKEIEREDDSDCYYATLEWPVDGWVWRIGMDEDDPPRDAVPAIAGLLAGLPGHPTADVRLVQDDVAFDFHVRVDGSQLYVVGELGSAAFETHCARTLDGLLSTIQDIHDSCGNDCAESVGSIN